MSQSLRRQRRLRPRAFWRCPPPRINAKTLATARRTRDKSITMQLLQKDSQQAGFSENNR